MALEKMMHEIDCKTISIFAKLGESQKRIWDMTSEKLNELCEKKNIKERNIQWGDIISVSETACKKIVAIIKEDNIQRAHLHHN